ncbi:MAG: hypothetical protein PHT41_02525 [Candidatus Omnitrophica bacterium]|nr:hypothetical protein [Candidatus Omnitrophota bacterium]MDD5238015.1 hypothetical protein [Candidatus Omnitrophota bacterium]
MRYTNKRGQGVLELSLFSVIILIVLGSILGFIQQMNDQQYVQMEAFRRALQKGGGSMNTLFQGGAGAAVNMTVVQHRRNIDLNFFKKGQLSPVSASSSVLWSIPEIGGARPQNLVVYRINEDEPIIPQAIGSFTSMLELPTIDLPILGEQSVTVGVADIKTLIDPSNPTIFNEHTNKQENAAAITNTRTSTLKDTIRTSFGYTVIPTGLIPDILNIDPATFPTVDHSIAQKLYGYKETNPVDPAHPRYFYKYSQNAPDGTEVQRGRQWQTPF